MRTFAIRILEARIRAFIEEAETRRALEKVDVDRLLLEDRMEW